MNMDPYFKSELLQNQIDAQKRRHDARQHEFGSALNKLKLLKRKEKLAAERSLSLRRSQENDDGSMGKNEQAVSLPQFSRSHAASPDAPSSRQGINF